MARRFKGGEDTSSPSAEHAPGPLVTLSRRCGVRAALGLRVLVVLRSVLTDDTGRLVASRLVPMLVHPVEQPTRVGAIEWMARLLSAIDGSPLGVNQDGLSPWLQTSRAAHSALWEARLNRERAIGNHAEARRRTQRQPGLFSAWAEQQILAADRRAPEAEASARAIAASEQARHLNFHAATPVLILIP
jgi:hypothetical protein